MGMAKPGLEAGVRYLATSLGPGSTRVNAIPPGPIRHPWRHRPIKQAVRQDAFCTMKADANAPQLTIDEVGNCRRFTCARIWPRRVQARSCTWMRVQHYRHG